MEWGLLKFSSANINPYGMPQSLPTNVAGIIPVILGSTAQSILVFQLLNLDFSEYFPNTLRHIPEVFSSTAATA